MHCGAVQYPITIRKSPEDVACIFDSFQNLAICPTANGLGCQQPGALQLSLSNQRSRFLKPVRHQIGFVRHAAFVDRKESVHIGIAQLSAHLLAAQERRVADDDVRLGPSRFPRLPALVVGQDGVHLLDVVQLFEHRVRGQAVAVLVEPLNVADPDGDLRQLVGVGVGLDAVELFRRGRVVLKGEPRRQAVGERQRRRLLPEIEQFPQRHVEEVAAAARRVQHADVGQFLLEGFNGLLNVVLIARLRRLVIAAVAALGVGGDLHLHLLPAAAQRRHQHRLHDQQNILFAGVVRAQLRPLAGVQAALKKRAEDRRFDAGPIQPADLLQDAQAVAVQFQCCLIVKQAAVEVADAIRAKVATDAHIAKELLQQHPEVSRLALRLLDQAREEILWQQAHIFSEKAEEQADKEVRAGLRRFAVAPQNIGEPGKVGRRLARHLFRRLRRFERHGMVEHLVKHAALFRIEQIVQRQLVRALHCVGELGVDADDLHIGDDEQRRILQRVVILEQLLIRLIEVLVLALVLPGEVPLLPNVGEALSAGGFGRARLEGEPLAFRVVLGGRGMIQQAAEIVEVGLRAGALLERGLLPFGDKSLGRHRCHGISLSTRYLSMG